MSHTSTDDEGKYATPKHKIMIDESSESSFRLEDLLPSVQKMDRSISFADIKEEGSIIGRGATTKQKCSNTVSLGSAFFRKFTSLRSRISLGQGRRSSFAGFRSKKENTGFRVSKNLDEMKLQYIEAFFYNHGMGIALGSLYMALNILMAAYGAYQFSEAGGWVTDNAVLRVTLPIARAGGRLVTLNCAILLLTACKYQWTMVRTYVTPVFPIGFPIDSIMPEYHRYVALMIIISGCIIHTLPQIVNYASQSIAMDHEGIKMWTFGDGFATKQLLVTGTLLVVIFSTFFLTTLKSFRKTAAGFRWFWMFHMGGIATAYPLLIIHGTCFGYPVFLYFALLPLAMYIFDVSMRRKNIFAANIFHWRVHEDEGQQVTELMLECPKGFAYTPGQYAELKFAPVSTREWHPFTIASAPSEGATNDKVVFYIKNSGRWTGAFMNYASAYDLEKCKTPLQISIRGPHGAPAMNYSEYKHIMVIGSGVGVTPLLSIWEHLVGKGRALAAENKLKSPWETMEQSIRCMAQSVNWIDQADLREFQSESQSLKDFLGVYSLPLKPDFDSTFEESTRAIGKIRLNCTFLAQLLESMTVSMFIFIFILLGETVTVLLQMTGYYLAANVIGSSIALIASILHGGIVIILVIVVGWSAYFQHIMCWLECSITIVNCFAFWYFVQGYCMARKQEDIATSRVIASNLIMSFVVALQAVRIFHIYYMALGVPMSSTRNKKKDDAEEFCSVEGILINRKYSNMRFAANKLLPPILDTGLSDVFSMYFYGTREKPKPSEKDEEITEHSLIRKMMGSHGAHINVKNSIFYQQKGKQDDFFCAGRPNWNHLFLRAISRAHVMNEEGDSVGVFFCGSPAIANDLKKEARRVTAQHQFSTMHLNGKGCKCKLIVHSENF